LLIKYGAGYWRYQASRSRKQQKPRPRGQGARILSQQPQGPQRIANVELPTIASSPLDDVLVAAKEDAAYRARVAAPPTGYTAQGELLWHGDRLCVPASEGVRTALLSECHDSVTGGHFGRDKTLAAVKQRFEWDGMASDVERYVATCDACQRNKPSQQLTPGLLMPLPLPERPCMEWTQDMVSGLPRTKRGHDAIQVYVERLCKMKHFVAVRSTDGAKVMAASFSHTVIRAHGVPEADVSDRDPRFTAHFYSALCKLLGTKLRMSTARHPQSDGQSENGIKALITSLRNFCNENQDDWDDYLDMLELGFNSAVQASTQFSPYELLYGCKPRLPIDAAFAEAAPLNPAAVDRAQRMRGALAVARGKLLEAQQRQARNADRHRREASLAVGDLVLLSTDGLRLKDFGNKLCSRYIGPFPVTAVVNANAYTLALRQQLEALHPTFNIDRLKLYRDGRAAFPSRPQRFDRPPPEAEADTNGDQLWEVERILAQRKRGRRIECLVAWRGYPAEENTWEPRSSLKQTAAAAVADFEQDQLEPASED
jgi:hypothetical protein